MQSLHCHHTVHKVLQELCLGGLKFLYQERLHTPHSNAIIQLMKKEHLHWHPIEQAQ